MPKVTDAVKAEKIKLARQMRKDDVGWDAIAGHADIHMPVATLRRWLGEGGETSRAKPKRGAKAEDAATIKELRAENTRLQALVSDILLGKVKLEKQ